VTGETLLTIRTVKAITLAFVSPHSARKKKNCVSWGKYSDHFRRAAGNRYNCQSPVEAGWLCDYRKSHYTGAIAVFKSRGAEIADVPLSCDGPNLNILEYNLKKYKQSLLHNTVFSESYRISYSNEKRKEILALAERYDAYIIEDDYVSGLTLKIWVCHRKSMDKSDRVIFLKSFSKIFMPGLRLALWLCRQALKVI